MEEISNKENVCIKVQFEYLNDNDVLDLSKEYKINISLLEDTKFETNKQKIINDSNFKTPKERSLYHMFNKSKKKFLTKNSDFIPYIKTNSSIILINCYKYAEEILLKLKEELNSKKLSDENGLKMNEIRKKELELSLNCLENNLQVDLFADEFIFKDGIEYLVLTVNNSNGNIRMNALNALSKLLSFENAFDFFEKKPNLLSILEDVFITSEEKNCAYSLFDIIVKLIGGNEEKTMNLIKKMNENFFNKIINYLSEENIDDKTKNHTLLFINMMLNFASPYKQLDLVNNLTDAKIFVKLENIMKYKEMDFLEQLNLFEISIEKILKEGDKDNENYNKIKEEFDIFVTNKKIYHIQNLIKASQSEEKEVKESAIDELNDLLKQKDYTNIIIESFLKNENIDILNSFYDYIIQLIKSSEEKLLEFINYLKKDEEKNNIKAFSQIIKYLQEENKDEIRSHTLLFITEILNSTNKDNQLEILFLFIDIKILDLLIKMEHPNEDFLEQLNKFESKIVNILENSQNEDKNYKLIKAKFYEYREIKIYNEIRKGVLNIHNITDNKNKAIEIKKLTDYIKEKEAYTILYKVFMDNTSISLSFSIFDVFVKLFGENEEKTMLFVNIAKSYAEANKTTIFKKIVYYTSKENKNNLIKGQALQIINMLINFSKKEKQYEILSYFTESEIFENLNALINNKDPSIMAQMKLFLNSVKSILKTSDKKAPNYNIINEKFNELNENKIFYEKTMDDFVVVEDDEF